MDEHISLAKDYEVRHWMRELACTETQLLEAVRAVGPREQDVREHIRTRMPLWSRLRALRDGA